MIRSAANAEDVYFAALSIEPGAARSGFLDRVCGDDVEFRRNVEGLLAVDPLVSKFLESPAVAWPEPSGSTGWNSCEAEGTVIGPYTLLEQIGEGGMGVVFLAGQVRPIRRHVALKIIKPGMDTRRVVARFEAERQALAMMEHPNIARIFDAGSTASGRPYFVMELVQGIPITEYADSHRLTVDERLDLFVRVCQAVQHAHQKGIIHRDLKPSNVLVAVQEGEPVPKVIDFGVAKAAGGERFIDRTFVTVLPQLMGTPLYMSPEQAASDGADVDTRSDVYSLGVLLYELLSGTTPFDLNTLRNSPIDEVRRIIREHEPPPPSARLTTLGDGQAAASANRRTEHHKLHRSLRGDLDWIVMKALEKDRRRRYATAAAFSDDVRRYRLNEPVEAGPPSTWYRFRKFTHRNRGAMLTAGLGGVAALIAVAALAVGAVMINGERRAAELERRRAEENFQKAREAVDRVFTRAAEEMAGMPHMEQVRRALLEDALQFYEGFLGQKGDDPAVRREAAQTYLRIGRIYRLLGRYKESLKPLDHARAMLEDLSRRSPDVPVHREDLAEVYNHLSYANQWLDRWDVTLEYRRKWLDLLEQLLREFPAAPKYLEQAAYARAAFAVALTNVGRPREAIEQFQIALAQYERRRVDFPDVPPDRELVGHAYHWLGDALEKTGRRGEAEQAYRRSYAIREERVAEDPRVPDARHQLSHIGSYLAKNLIESGRPAEAEPLLHQSVGIGEALLDDYPDHADYLRRAAIDYRCLAIVLARGRRGEEAEAAMRRAVALRTRIAVKNPDRPVLRDLAWYRYQLGLLLETTGGPEAAAVEFRSVLDMLEKLLDEYPETSDLIHGLGWMLATCPDVRLRDPGRAVALARRAVRSEPRNGEYWTGLGVACYRAGNPSGAVESLDRAIGLYGGEEAVIWTFLAMAHWRLGHRDEARSWYVKAVAWIETNQPLDEQFGRFRAEAAGLLGVNVPGAKTNGDAAPPAAESLTTTSGAVNSINLYSTEPAENPARVKRTP